MKYLKNIEIAEQYKVSPNTVGNWIESAKKNGLTIISENHRKYILNNSSNHLILKNLSKKGQKYKNTKSLKIISPRPEFYEIFDDKQIIDIITNLELYREIDLKYIYFEDKNIGYNGAKYYSDYYDESLVEKSGNTPKNTIELLSVNRDFLLNYLKHFKAINVVDVGVGNGVSVKKFISFLTSKGFLNKYVGIDYSKDILELAKQNFNKWFGDTFLTEFHIRDFTYDGIRDLLFISSQEDMDTHTSMNLILFMGSTIENQRSSLQSLTTLKNSMGPNDLLVLGQTLNSEASRAILNFRDHNESDPIKVNNNHNDGNDLFFFFLPRLLNIDPEFYSVERLFSEKDGARVERISLNVDLNINIKTKKINRTLKFSKRDKIVVWRHRHHRFNDVVKDLNEAGFEILHISTSMDYGNIMSISRVKLG